MGGQNASQERQQAGNLPLASYFRWNPALLPIPLKVEEGQNCPEQDIRQLRK